MKNKTFHNLKYYGVDVNVKDGNTGLGAIKDEVKSNTLKGNF